MIEVRKDRRVKVYGVCFNGLNELLNVALSHKPKDGVYVGMRRDRYPCFDSYDYTYENRYYTHFVFGRSKEELEHRLEILNSKTVAPKDGSAELRPGPTIYWEGDEHEPMQIPECDDVEVVQPHFMAALQEWNKKDKNL